MTNPHRLPPSWARWLVARLVRGPHREFILGDLEEGYSRNQSAARVANTSRFLIQGSITAIATWRLRPTAGIASDFIVALRQIRREPRVFLGAGVILSIGLGMGTFTWGIQYGSLGRGLPVSEPDRLVAAQLGGQGLEWGQLAFSPEDRELVQQAPSVEVASLWNTSTVTVRQTGSEAPPRRTTSVMADPSLMSILEFRPALGRLLDDRDERAEAEPVVALSYQLWQSRFDSDSAIVGSALMIGDVPTTVVGVLSEGSRFSGNNEIWQPAGARVARDQRDFMMVVKTGEGLELSAVNDQLSVLSERFAPFRDQLTPQVRVLKFAPSFRGPHTSVYTRVITWSGVFLFLMAIANAANLFIVLANRRSHEMSVRRALGASQFRILRQVSIEALVPAAIGITGGIAVADLALGWYQGAAEAYVGGLLDSWRAYRVEAPHIAVITAGGLLSTVVVILLASLGRNSSTDSLRSSRGTTRSRFALGRSLVATEIALGGALMLLASLMITSSWNLQTNDWGFQRNSVLTGEVRLPQNQYLSAEERNAFWSDVRGNLDNTPGVVTATVASQLPMIRFSSRWRVRRPIETFGAQTADPSSLPVHYVAAVDNSYFDTFEAPVLEGREFDARDNAESAPVAVVNKPFAERYFPDESPVGQQVRLWNSDGPGEWRTIIGVAPHLWMDTDENRFPEGIYIPLDQGSPAQASLAIRVNGDPENFADQLREAVWVVDPDLAVEDVRSMEQLIHYRTSLYRKDGPVFILLGLTAFVLSIVGLYAVVSYIASTRTGEMSIRAMLGAQRRRLMSAALKSELLPMCLGVGFGVVLGLSLTRGFARLMFLVDPWSPAVVVVSFGLIVCAALLASLVPALKVSRADLSRVANAE